MEAIWANQTHEDTLVDSRIVRLVFIWAVINTSALVEQESIDTGGTHVNFSITCHTRFFTLSANLIYRCLPLLTIALPFASAICVEHKPIFALSASVDIANAGETILLACLAQPAVRYVDLLISLANFEAVVVKGIKLHVALTTCASLGCAFTSLAASIARVASSSRDNTDFGRARWETFVVKVEGGTAHWLASCAVVHRSAAASTAFFAAEAEIVTWVIDVSC